MTVDTTPSPTTLTTEGRPVGKRVTTRTTSWRRFARHYVVMLLAMYAGMVALDPVYVEVATRAGYADPWVELPVISALVMAVNMTVPMVLLMSHHRHGRRATCEMAGSMIAPTLAAAGLHALGAIPADQVMTVAHLAMFPAMFLVMLARYSEYATARHRHTAHHRTLAWRNPS